LITVGVVFGIGVGASSAHAAPARWAFLLANQPLLASYTPDPRYQANSSGFGVLNTVTRSGAGQYLALLPNLGGAAGTVHVTADGSYTQHCKVAFWGPSFGNPTTQQVGVRCFNQSGALSDSRFTLSYADPVVPDARMAYLWANQASAAFNTPYIPALNYQFNSMGAPNTVTRTAAGVYTASLPNLPYLWAGHVQVTAYGFGNERCKVSHWAPVGSGINVEVRCFTGGSATLHGGFPVDTRFTLTYVEGNSLIGGISTSGPNFGTESGYLWADQPTLPSYTPSVSYQWTDLAFWGPATVTRSGVGSYTVHTPIQWGTVQVTAYGTGSEYCKLAGWGPSGDVEVRCYDMWNRSVATLFTLAFLDYHRSSPDV
jgi:hypothetical protein